MRRAISLLFLAVLVLCASAAFARNEVSVPGWVHDLAGQQVGSYSPKTEAVVLLDEEEETVTGEFDYTEHHRRVVKILRPEGRDEAHAWTYIEPSDKLISIHAWAIDSAGHEFEVKDKDFLESNPFNYLLYEDVKYRHAPIPGAAVGSVIAFEYEVRRHAFFNELSWTPQEDNPVRDARFIVQLPPGWVTRFGWKGNNLQPTEAGANRWLWSVHELPGIEHEPLMPSHANLASRLSVMYFPPSADAPQSASWDTVGKWYNGLTSGRRAASTDISQKAHEVTSGKTDFDGKVRAIANFMQSEVRYVAIEMGIGGYQPHPASDVFHYRYGDCKDKATLMSSLLHEVGVRSEYMLIDTDRGYVKPEAPSNRFNHAIIAIEVPDDVKTEYASVVKTKSGKRYLIFDPTNRYLPVGMLSASLQDNYGLLVTPTGGELLHLPMFTPERSVLERVGKFTLKPDGSIEGEVTEQRTGVHAGAERAALMNAPNGDRAKFFDGFLSRSLGGYSLLSSEVEHLDQPDSDLIVRYKLSANAYAQNTGPLMLVRPRVLGEKTIDINWRDRKQPVQLRQTSDERDIFEFQIPEGYTVDDVPPPVKIDVGFASYQSKVDVDGSKIRYTREYIVRDIYVPQDKFADLKKLAGHIGADEQSSVVLKHQSNPGQ